MPEEPNELDYVGAVRLMRDEPAWSYPGIWAGQKPICRLRVFSDPRGPLICVVTELEENPGASVTNCAEKIYAKLQDEYPGCIHVEHYARRSGFDESFSIFKLGPESSPIWTPYLDEERPFELD